MSRLTPDLCVIGAGSGGLSVAAGAVQMGASVVLIEGGRMGGDCLNYGCVPSKALLAAAKQAQAMRAGGPFGVAPVEPEVDYAAAMDHVAQAIATIAPVDSQERFEGLGCTVIRDWAAFTSASEVQAGGDVIAARRFVVATGSTALLPPIPGLDGVPYLTNETLFENREKPAHLLVIGGGPIGLEMAQAHRRLGCDVTVIEGGRALGKDDPEAAAVVLDALQSEGVAIHEGIAAERVSGYAGAITVEAGGQRFQGSHLLVAVGRKAATERLNLAAAGIETDRGAIRTDARLRSTNRKVYAVGDVAGRQQFTHVANYHAGIVIRQALFGLPAKLSDAHVPWATYTDPELAQVGLTEAAARKAHGDRLTVARFDFAENDRAVAERETRGFAKVMVLRGRPVGATVVGAQAGEQIALWALMIASGRKMSAIAGMIVPYPTLGEVSKRAAGAYFSPRLFDNPWVVRAVRLVQRWIP